MVTKLSLQPARASMGQKGKVSTPKCDTCFGLVNWGVVETKKFMS
jgi:hypothetical protein